MALDPPAQVTPSSVTVRPYAHKLIADRTEVGEGVQLCCGPFISRRETEAHKCWLWAAHFSRGLDIYSTIWVLPKNSGSEACPPVGGRLCRQSQGNQAPDFHPLSLSVLSTNSWPTQVCFLLLATWLWRCVTDPVPTYNTRPLSSGQFSRT